MALFEDIEIVSPTGPTTGQTIQHAPDLKAGAYLAEGGPIEPEPPESPMAPLGPPPPPLQADPNRLPPDLEIDFDEPVRVPVKKHLRTHPKSVARKSKTRSVTPPPPPPLPLGNQEFGRKPVRSLQDSLKQSQNKFRFDKRPFRESEEQRAKRLGRGIARPTSAAEKVTDVIAPLARLDFLPTPLQDRANRIRRTAMESLAKLPQGIAEAADWVDRRTTEELLPFSSETELGLGSKLQPLTNAAQKAIRQMTPYDESKKGFMEEYIYPGIGSGIGFAATGLTGGALGLSSKMISGATGASGAVAQFAEESRKAGVSQERFERGLPFAAVTGLTEILGLGRKLDQLGMGRTFRQFLFDVAEEGGQEALQGWLTDVNAGLIAGYSPTVILDPKIAEFWKKRGKEFAGGAVVGGLFGAPGLLDSARGTTYKGEETSRPGSPFKPDASAGQPPVTVQGEIIDSTSLPSSRRRLLEPATEEGVETYRPETHGPPPPPSRTIAPSAPGPGITLRSTNTVGMSPEEWEAFGPSPFQTGERAPYNPYAQRWEEETIADKVARAKLRKQARKSLEDIPSESLAGSPAEWELREKLQQEIEKQKVSPSIKRRSPKTMKDIVKLTKRLRQRDESQARGGLKVELASFPMHGNQLAQDILSLPDTELAQAMIDMGGSPDLVDGDKDLMARWLVREFTQRLGGLPRAPLAETTETKQAFEQKIKEQAESEDLEGLSERRLGMPLQEAIHTYRQLAKLESASDRFLDPEESDLHASLWSVFHNDNGTLRIPKRAFDKIKLMSQDDLSGIAKQLADEPIPPDASIETLTAIETLKRLKAIAPMTQKVLELPTERVPAPTGKRQTELQKAEQRVMGLPGPPPPKPPAPPPPPETWMDELYKRTEALKRAGGLLKGISEQLPEDVGSLIDREANAKAFVSQADPRLRLPDGSPRPVYHGTQSPIEITEIDFSKLDPNALYGPGFYTTQDPEVAAGEGGYTTKPQTRLLLDSEALDHPLYDQYYESNRRRVIEEYIANPPFKPFDPNSPVMREAYDSQAHRKTVDQLRDEQQRPHAYKFYLNIKRPFDLEKRYSLENIKDIDKAIQKWTRPWDTGASLIDKLKLNRYPEDTVYGEDVYDAVRQMVGGDKSTTTEALKEAGFDGITHIGGNRRVFETREEAEAEAERVGAPAYQMTIHPWHTETLDKWAVDGHRVWIAFHPNQVKSATGNIGTYDPDLSSISQSLFPSGFLSRKGAQDYEFIYHGGPDKPALVRAPDRFWKILEPHIGPAMGINIPDYLYDTVNRVVMAGMNDVEANKFAQAFARAQMEAEAQGLRSVNFSKYDLPEEEELVTARHETWHAGQGKALPSTAKHGTELHDPSWAKKNEYVNRALDTSRGRSIMTGTKFDWNDHMAFELAAYSAQSPIGANSMGLDFAEQLDYLDQYLAHIAEYQGPEALIRFAEPVIMRPGVQEVYNWALEKAYERIGQQSPTTTTSLERAGQSQLSNTAGSLGGIAQIRGPDGPGHGPSQAAGGGAGGTGGGTGGTGSASLGKNPGLYNQYVSARAMESLTKAFIQALKAGGGTFHPGVPPFLQVKAAIMNGWVRPDQMDAILRAEGVTWDDFANEYEASVSEFARGLAYHSHIERKWAKALADDPSLYKLLGPSLTNLRVAIKATEQTMLGRDWYERLGNAAQGIVLTQLKTVFTNVQGASMQLPVRMFSDSFTGAMHYFQQTKGSDRSLAERIAEASEEAGRAIEGPIQVLLKITPEKLAKLIPVLRSHEYIATRKNLAQMTEAFPELEEQLSGLSYGPKSLPKGRDRLKLAQQIERDLPQYPKDPVMQAKRDELVKRLRVLEARDEFNRTAVGKIINKGEGLLELALTPLVYQEAFLRKPYFMGALIDEAAQEGVDYVKALREGTAHKIPYEAMSRALDRAMEVTMARMPKAGKGQVLGEPMSTVHGHVEKAAHDIIHGINKAGYPGFMLGGFPKIMYESARFLYEFSPLGFTAPGSKFLAKTLAKKPGQAEWGREDWRDLGKAMAGSLLFVAAWLTRKYLGGEKWNQIKTGATDKSGNPIYMDMSPTSPFAAYLWTADMADRISHGTVPEPKEVSREFAKVFMGLQRTDVDSPFSMLGHAANYWGNGEGWENMPRNVQLAGGNAIGMWFTPFVNLRDLAATFAPEENFRREFRGNEMLGPTLDKIPWLRSAYLGRASSPTQGETTLGPAPFLAQAPGLRLVQGENPSGEELVRLGVNINRWLKPDRDPTIHHAQNMAMYELLNEFGGMIMSDPSYQTSSPIEQRSRWEQLIGGTDGLASAAKQAGYLANPSEAMRRGVLQSTGPFERKATGIDEIIKQELPR